MRTAIITAAGISERFNKGIPEDEKQLKIIYYEDDKKKTLLYELVKKCSFADRIVVVGGYKFGDLEAYIEDKEVFDDSLRDKIIIVKNDHFSDLASGYSFYVGLKEAMALESDEILFAEGDLDVDVASFDKIIDSEGSVLSYNHETIYANKAVVLYMDSKGQYRYAFNSAHGCLKIDDEFSMILNSGQIWKFSDMRILQEAIADFEKGDMSGTNLQIIGYYFGELSEKDISLVGFDKWTNCNTREDYRKIFNGSK